MYSSAFPGLNSLPVPELLLIRKIVLWVTFQRADVSQNSPTLWSKKWQLQSSYMHMKEALLFKHMFQASWKKKKTCIWPVTVTLFNKMRQTLWCWGLGDVRTVTSYSLTIFLPIQCCCCCCRWWWWWWWRQPCNGSSSEESGFKILK